TCQQHQNLVPKLIWKSWVLSNDSFFSGTARSSRIGPTGDFHATPAPALARIAVESWMTGVAPPVETSCAGVKTRFFWSFDQRLPKSLKIRPLIPSSLGRPSGTDSDTEPI